MGGATDLPQRSSSPLKRRASNLETDSDARPEDVEMATDPPREPHDDDRESSVDMLRSEQSERETSLATENVSASTRHRKTSGRLLMLAC